MGYFPNGSSGTDYQDNLCERCSHFGPQDGPGCPIMYLHMLWNYDAVGSNADKTKATALNVFIPLSADGLGNEQCKMFVPLEHLTEMGRNIVTQPDRARVEQQRLVEWQKIYSPDIRKEG